MMMNNAVDFYRSKGWYVTSPYGMRTINGTLSMHRGIDFGGQPCNGPVHAAFGGKVVAAKTSGMGTWGNTVCIEINDSYVTLNAHLAAITCKEGDIVRQGDVIGLNGGSNHSGKDYACHIHFEVQRNNGSAPWRGDHIDPAKFYTSSPESKPASTKFKAGDKIKNTLTGAAVNTRHSPGSSEAVVGKVNAQEMVVVLDHIQNGKYATGYYWWHVLNGWVAEQFFEKVEPTLEDAPELEESLEILLEKLYKHLKARYS